MAAPRIFVAGPASWNTIVDLDRLPESRPHMVRARGHHQAMGGTSAGKALNLASLGARVTLRTLLGTDEARDHVLAALSHEHVELVVETAAGPSEQHLNLMTPAGDRLSIYLDLPEPGPERHAARTRAALAGCDVAIVDLSEHSRPLLREARALGKPVWCDLHDYDGRSRFHQDFVDAADVLFLNDDGLEDPVAFLGERVARGLRLGVVTQGADGATAVTARGTTHLPAEPVSPVVDTNGAGDAFLAGFLLAHLGGADTADCLRAGHVQAGRCLRVRGLAPSGQEPERR